MSLHNRGSLEPYLPDSIRFYDHQTEGIRRMAYMRNFLLADEMGLGKTVQSAAVFVLDVYRSMGDSLCVVCPASLKGNWYDEMGKFTRIHREILDGTPTQRSKQLEQFRERVGPKILIVNYEQVVGHLKELSRIGFHVSVYDEAHYLKNPKAKRTKACHQFMTTRRFLLTGSPLLNHVNELWSLLEMIEPGEWGKYYSFCNRYCNTPDAPIWMADGTFKPIGEIQVGDKVMGWENAKGNGEPNDRRRIVESEVLEVRRRIAPEVIKVAMESGQVIKCTPDHQWLSGSNGGAGANKIEWVNVQSKKNPERLNILSRVVLPTKLLTPEKQRLMDWLAGMMDGEGTGTFIAQCVNHNPKIHARIGEVLDELGIEYTVTANGYRLKGGRQLYANLATWTKGVLQKDQWIRDFLFHSGGYSRKTRKGQLNRRKERPVSVESMGPGEVVSMQTTSGNYVAWGLASKNCVYGGFKDKQIIGVKNEKELTARLQNVMIRRLKKDVLDLPEVQYVNRPVDLHPKQRKYYDEVFGELKLSVAGRETVDIQNALTKFLRLKQICGTTASINPDSPDDDYSTKLDLAANDADQILASGHKIVAFTQFRSVQSSYEKRIRAIKRANAKGRMESAYEVFILNGDTPTDRRQEVVRRWAEFDAKPAILIAMYQVAGVGLNMTEASHMQRLDRLFVPELNEQAIARLHRIGQKNEIQVLDYIVRKTVEQRVEKIVKQKKSVFENIVERDNWQAAVIAAALAEEEEREQAA